MATEPDPGRSPFKSTWLMPFWVRVEVWLLNISTRDKNDVMVRSFIPHRAILLKYLVRYCAKRFIDPLTRTVAIHLLYSSAFMVHRRFIQSNCLCLQAMEPAGYYLLLALNSVSGVLYRSWFPHCFEQHGIINERISLFLFICITSNFQIRIAYRFDKTICMLRSNHLHSKGARSKGVKSKYSS